MREPPRYETAERLGLAPRSGFVQPFGQADALRAAPSARGLPQTLDLKTVPMAALELKIPPPVVALLVAGAMWGGSLALPASAPPTTFHVVAALALALVGGLIALSGVISFRRAKTTVSPMKPETTASLVTAGIYRFTRNPMYLGLLLVLIALMVYLSSVWLLVGPVAFVLYMNGFQVAPEEHVLSRMFGAAYTAYQSRVRRWL